MSLNKLFHKLLIIYLIYTVPSHIVAENLLLKKKLVVSGLPDYFPFSFQENGELKGAFIDMTNDILSRLNITAEYRVLPWKRVLNSAKVGSVDLVAGLYKSESRETFIDYSVAIIDDPTAVFMRKGKEFKYENWSDLIGKTGVTGLGYVLGDKFSQYEKIHLNMHRVEGSNRALILLADDKRRFDYSVNGYYHTLQLLAQLDLSEKITYSSQFVTRPYLYFGFSKKNSLGKLMIKVNNHLIEYKKIAL